jgi:hypothetical protein
MVRRILVFSGIPSGLGLSSFFVNYYLLTNHVIALPPYFTLVESLAVFGLGWEWYEALKKNKTVLVQGNGAVARNVASGEQSMTLVNDTLDYTENNAQYVQYGCLVWLGM